MGIVALDCWRNHPIRMAPVQMLTSLILTGFVDEVAGAVALGLLDAAEAVEHSRLAEDCWYPPGLHGKA
jgi:hypothetical protein